MLDLHKFKVYVVGGYVRDRLLGREPKDHDFVVVGATPADMIAAGFEPIEAAFPIFIDPRSRDEYALARKERKTGVGYHGFEVEFDPTVTLEEDLYRRDLTMNAMAREVIGWNELGHAKLSDDIIDPYDGRQDIQDAVIRHVSEAFAEDPVRVLRAARFAARYVFDVHPDTLELMEKVAPELDHVPHERIWTEFEKGLMEKSPWLMFEVLRECGAMDTQALKAYAGARTIAMRFITPDTPLEVRFILAAQGFEGIDYGNCRIPTNLERVSDAFNTYSHELWMYSVSTADERMGTLTAMRAITDDTKLFTCMDALMLLAKVRGPAAIDTITDTVSLMKQDLINVRSVDAAAIAAMCKDGQEKKCRIREHRVAAMIS